MIVQLVPMLTDIDKPFQLDVNLKQLFRLNKMYSDVLKAKCFFVLFFTKDANKTSVIRVCSFLSL